MNNQHVKLKNVQIQPAQNVVLHATDSRANPNGGDGSI